MRIGDVVDITCLDNGLKTPGVIHRISKNSITVVMNKGDVTLTLIRKGYTNQFIGSKGGLEFSLHIWLPRRWGLRE
jgi:hypothetical protein